MVHPANVSSSLNNPITLPDIGEIERMEQLERKAIEALEICGESSLPEMH
jgi:hypothetical protein